MKMGESRNNDSLLSVCISFPDAKKKRVLTYFFIAPLQSFRRRCCCCFQQTASDLGVFPKFAFQLPYLVDESACDRLIQKSITEMHQLGTKTFNPEIAKELQEEMVGSIVQLRTMLAEVTSSFPSKINAWKSMTSKLGRCEKATEREIKKDIKRRKRMEKKRRQSSADAAAAAVGEASEPEPDSPAVSKKKGEEQSVREKCAELNSWLVQAVLDSQKQREHVFVKNLVSFAKLLKNSSVQTLTVCNSMMGQLEAVGENR